MSMFINCAPVFLGKRRLRPSPSQCHYQMSWIGSGCPGTNWSAGVTCRSLLKLLLVVLFELALETAAASLFIGLVKHFSHYKQLLWHHEQLQSENTHFKISHVIYRVVDGYISEMKSCRWLKSLMLWRRLKFISWGPHEQIKAFSSGTFAQENQLYVHAFYSLSSMTCVMCIACLQTWKWHACLQTRVCVQSGVHWKRIHEMERGGELKNKKPLYS